MPHNFLVPLSRTVIETGCGGSENSGLQAGDEAYPAVEFKILKP